jgi:hypothetical protein
VIKRISLLVMAALLVATMAMAGLAGPAFAAKSCTENTNGCSTPNRQEKKDAGESQDFDTTTTHRGKGQANGTPRETKCFLPSGNEVSCTHPQFAP